MPHPTEVPGFRSFGELARAIAELRYDKLNEFLIALSFELTMDAVADQARGRPKRAKALAHVAGAINNASDEVDELLLICKPHL